MVLSFFAGASSYSIPVLTMFKRTYTNTFPTVDDCEMFLMVLRQQWPKYLEQLPDARLEICQSFEMPNQMQAIWTFKRKEDIKKMEVLAQKLIFPYRQKLSPKTTTFSGSVIALD
jgi:hypothetical protein|tara:strand:+ start:373 stop:717 length:345 start_codon:yes stop_codon:yes gene_type:complete